MEFPGRHRLPRGAGCCVRLLPNRDDPRGKPRPGKAGRAGARSGRRSSTSTTCHTVSSPIPLTAEYLAIACTGCNAARRDKPLAVWVDEMGIRDTVAPVVTAYLRWPTASLAIDPACRLEDRLAAESQRATRKASLGATLALAA